MYSGSVAEPVIWHFGRWLVISPARHGTVEIRLLVTPWPPCSIEIHRNILTAVSRGTWISASAIDIRRLGIPMRLIISYATATLHRWCRRLQCRGVRSTRPSSSEGIKSESHSHSALTPLQQHLVNCLAQKTKTLPTTVNLCYISKVH